MKPPLLVLAVLASLNFTATAAPRTKPAAKPAVKPAAKPSISPNDPQRFFKVKEWNGTFATGAGSTGQKKESYVTMTWSSKIRVEGNFKLTPHYDNRNLDPFSLQGTGEARIYVTGKKVYQYKEEVTTDTFNGDYVDKISIVISNIKPDKGTYEFSIRIPVWQEQAHKGKAIEKVSVTRSRYGSRTTTDMVPGHGWAADGGAGFGGAFPLPKQGFVINGKLTRGNDDFLSMDGSKWDSTWTIKPGGPEFEEPLKANAGGPYEVERGKTINLDGFKSTGKIRSYKWTFEPAGDASIPFNAGSSKEGKRVPVVMLAPIKATLTVSDGKKQDMDSVVVKVVARDYKTPFQHREGEEVHPRSIPPRMIKGRDLKYAGGENVCAQDNYNAKDSVHILHPPAQAGTWENLGYKVQQVQDPGGPFEGTWYVSSYDIQVDRKMLINKYILPKGPPPVRTAKPFYETNKAMGNDPDAYLAAVRKHELLHSELMEKGLRAGDPGLKIEPLAGKEKEALIKQVDGVINAAEKSIDEGSADPLPSVGYKGKLAYPDDATDKYTSVDVEF